MKNFIKIVPVILLFFAFSCEDEEERFGGDSTSGWVEFTESATLISGVEESVVIPVKINVPVYEDGIEIDYRISAVEEDFEPYVFKSSGTFNIDPIASDSESSGRFVNVEVPLRNLAAERRFVTVFDIVIEEVRPFSVRDGVNGNSITSHRVTLPCNAVTPDNLEADFLIGDFDIDNGEEAAFGAFFPQTVTITADPENPNIRRFSANLFSDAIDPFDFVLELIDGQFILQDIETPFSCNQGDDDEGNPNPSVPIVFSNAFGSSTFYDVCEDPNFLKVFIAEDLNNSCGGPVLGSFTLTKVDDSDD